MAVVDDNNEGAIHSDLNSFQLVFVSFNECGHRQSRVSGTPSPPSATLYDCELLLIMNTGDNDSSDEVIQFSTVPLGAATSNPITSSSQSCPSSVTDTSILRNHRCPVRALSQIRV
ncbi:hypothetical protein J6590_034953 [Homalodisca vitripennis]|nr:hypothetical protein J6590_034953 [Homalodisca vitripennis]